MSRLRIQSLRDLGATITMLLEGINGELKDAAEGNVVARKSLRATNAMRRPSRKWKKN